MTNFEGSDLAIVNRPDELKELAHLALQLELCLWYRQHRIGAELEDTDSGGPWIKHEFPMLNLNELKACETQPVHGSGENAL
jgi:hypothetical protein